MKKIIFILIIAIVSLIAYLAVWFNSATSVPLTKKDKEVLITVIEEIDYEYDSTDYDDPYITTVITYEASTDDADIAYKIDWPLQKYIYESEDMIIEENNEFYSVGHRSRFGHIKYESEIIGHTILIQKGSTIYSFTIVGMSIDDPKIWHSLFDEKIKKL